MFKKIITTSIALTAAVLISGCNAENGSNTAIDGVDGPHVTVSNGYVVTSMVFKNLSVEGGATLPIPNFSGSSISIGPDFQSAGTLLTLNLSVAEFWDNQDLQLDPHTLPGGRPLPTVSTGSLPAIAVVVPQLSNTVLYLGLDVIGFFVPFKLDTSGVIISTQFYNSEKVKVGTLSLVGADSNGENSGLLLLLSTELLGIGKNRAEYEATRSLY